MSIYIAHHRKKRLKCDIGTSSPGVAERLRDASCLLVVCFNNVEQNFCLLLLAIHPFRIYHYVQVNPILFSLAYLLMHGGLCAINRNAP